VHLWIVTVKGSREEEEEGEGYTSQKPLGLCAQEFCQMGFGLVLET
jgi:hypothetical protein